MVRSHTFETRDRIRKIECIKVKAEEKERERAINGSASEAEAAALYHVMKATRRAREPKILVCIQYMYSLIQQGTYPFYKQRITMLSQNSNSFCVP